jgi:U3 small nucleolar RNA-associated protein 21
MAAVPRAYWTSLFNLEAIKARNRATAAPEAPKQAPFFLPTVVRGGSTPSFPTPAEFALLMKQPAEGEGKKRKEGGVVESGKKQKKDTGRGEGDEEAKVLADLAAMSGAWDDADADGNWGDAPGEADGEAEVEGKGEGLLARVRAGSEVSVDTGFILDRKPMSRIINRKTALPRCKLVVFLLREYPGGVPAANGNDSFFAEEAVQEHEELEGDWEADGPILEYLKHLPPPAVDIELRALCAHDEDQEGLSLLRCLLAWFARKLKTGLNFEVLQAYLHRTLTIYAELVLKLPALGTDVEAVRRIHAESSGRFRQLVQSNLCLLKMLAGLPPT